MKKIGQRWSERYSTTMDKTIYELVYPKTREEWLSIRGLGGSDASVLINKNPWKSKLQLFMEKTGKSKPKDLSDNTYVKKGNKLEPLIRKQVAIYLGSDLKVTNPPKSNWLFRRLDKPYMTASLDGLITNKKTKETYPLEIKTHLIRNAQDKAEWESGHLPDTYYCQCLWYLAVTGAKRIILVANLENYSFDGETRRLNNVDQRYYYMEREPLEQEIEYLEQEATTFWEENVMKGVMPEIII